MFKITKTLKSGLRRGVLKTAHGSLSTPFFLPDATRGFIKLTDNEAVARTQTGALVVNAFHLYLQPGLKIIERAGGLHKFMDWSGSLLSDSGGFQIFSLIHKNGRPGKITDDKVIFRSPLDGSQHELTPEKSIQIQFTLGTDMMVCLDDCPPNDFSRPDLEKAVARTIAWAKRCKTEYLKQLKKRKLSGAARPLLFAVIQGGAEIDLRSHCAEELVKIGFDGYGFGARPVDKEGKFLGEVLQATADFIPASALRFAFGVGTPEDIYRCALMGWDMFDCVIPTREGRHGKLFFLKKFLKYENININNAKFAADFRPINKNSRLPELRRNSRAYLHHLFRLNEPLGHRLASLNNLEFYQNFIKDLSKIKDKK
ncbi:MAG: tRNA guanosine(34) transglycosylase Tgt [bacterium]|nr:tRNA guanosine(34) transglycosylase Tgt [bacterium]